MEGVGFVLLRYPNLAWVLAAEDLLLEIILGLREEITNSSRMNRAHVTHNDDFFLRVFRH